MCWNVLFFDMTGDSRVFILNISLSHFIFCMQAISTRKERVVRNLWFQVLPVAVGSWVSLPTGPQSPHLQNEEVGQDDL